jgi:hypothetical protein
VGCGEWDGGSWVVECGEWEVGGLEALELVQGAVERALDAALAAAVGVEGVGVLVEDVGEAVVGSDVPIVVVDVVPVIPRPTPTQFIR